MQLKSLLLLLSFVVTNSSNKVIGDTQEQLSALRQGISQNVTGELVVRVRVKEETVRSKTFIQGTYGPKLLDQLRARGVDPAKEVHMFEVVVAKNCLARIENRRGTDNLSAMNPEYGFTIVKAKSGWNLVDFAAREGDLFGNAEVNKAIQQTLDLLSPYSIYDLGPLSNYLDYPTTQVRSVEPVEVGTKRLIRLEFDCLNLEKEAVDSPVKLPIRNAYSVHDPSENWRIVECGYGYVGGTAVVRNVFTYQMLSSGVAIVASMTSEISNPEGANDWFAKYNREFEVVSESVDPMIFQLSNYGLPEPNLKRSMGWLYFLVAGVALVIVGIWVRKTKQSSEIEK